MAGHLTRGPGTVQIAALALNASRQRIMICGSTTSGTAVGMSNAHRHFLWRRYRIHRYSILHFTRLCTVRPQTLWTLQKSSRDGLLHILNSSARSHRGIHLYYNRYTSSVITPVDSVTAWKGLVLKSVTTEINQGVTYTKLKFECPGSNCPTNYYLYPNTGFVVGTTWIGSVQIE